MALGNIVVCIKSVPDPRCSMSLDPQTMRLCRTGAPAVINPLDRHALEEGICWREKLGGRVVVISMGPPQARNNLREALAIGADEAILLCDVAMAGADTLATARALAAAIRRVGSFDLVLCGAHSTDGHSGQVGPELAVLLGVPHLSQVKALELRDSQAVAVTQMDGAALTVEVGLPALFTVVKEMNTPRRASLLGIATAGQKPLSVWMVADLGVAAAELGAAGSPTAIAEIVPLLCERRGERLSGSPEETAKGLVRRLRQVGALPPARAE